MQMSHSLSREQIFVVSSLLIQIALAPTVSSGNGNIIPKASTVSSGNGSIIPKASTVSSGNGSIIPKASTVSSGNGSIIPKASTVSSGNDNIIPKVSTVKGGDEKVDNVNTNDLTVEIEAPVNEIDSCGSDMDTSPVAPASPAEAGSISLFIPQRVFSGSR